MHPRIGQGQGIMGTGSLQIRENQSPGGTGQVSAVAGTPVIARYLRNGAQHVLAKEPTSKCV